MQDHPELNLLGNKLTSVLLLIFVDFVWVSFSNRLVKRMPNGIGNLHRVDNHIFSNVDWEVGHAPIINLVEGCEDVMELGREMYEWFQEKLKNWRYQIIDKSRVGGPYL